MLAPGDASAQYHWEASQEEWLLVLEGSPTVRTPEGEQALRAGDVACFERGPAGAHQVINRSDAPVRIVLLSEVGRPEVIVYPDSGKVAVTTDGWVDGIFRLEDTVGYWE